jgi:hypothetical protein
MESGEGYRVHGITSFGGKCQCHGGSAGALVMIICV